VIDKDGHGDGHASSSSSECGRLSNGLTIFADRTATLAMVRDRVGPPTNEPCTHQLVFVASRQHPPEVDKMLGDYAAFLGQTAYIGGAMDAADSDKPSYERAMRVVKISDETLQIDGATMKLPLSPPGDSFYGQRIARIQYVFRPTDSVEHVLTTIMAVEHAYGPRLDWALQRELDDGVRPPPRSADVGGVVGFGAGSGAMMVNGRLPPEVVGRILRQNGARFRKCYQAGLEKNPRLAGTVRVKFVIDRAGDVATAMNGGSDIDDQGVVSCILHAVQNITFPQPDGGIVTVVYPMTFKQGSLQSPL
jgi:hypothetical protein